MAVAALRLLTMRPPGKIGTLTLLAILVLVPIVFVSQLRGGGVLYVAGVSGFDPNAEGKPITWANGAIVYFTDQGDAGPMLPQSTANAFVADALSRWTSVSTAALTATRGGALAEDVNGTNVTNSVDGIALPLDIQASATNKPLAIVYDNDGQVIDALLGAGASDASMCATNSVIGGADRFSTDAHIIHALIVINGRCAQNASDLPPLKYHLIRVLGRTLGLDWSQANNNVRTGMPFPSSEDFAGFPLMHPLEPFCASAITNCIANADQLRMDDRAAVSRLYPVVTQNISAFSGKQLLSSNTIRIHGSIYFPDVHGNPGQPMQGVNVVARLMDPNTGLPSERYVASSVSGFLFRGNAGNRVTGLGSSQRFDTFGSSQRSVEGFYDLAGLELPNGQLTATYQITVETVDPLYSGEFTVGPYSSGVVTPSGTTPAVLISGLSAGSDISKDIVMGGSRIARPTVDATEPNSFFTPSPIPSSGQWWGSLNGYGDEDFFTFSAHANRTFSLQVISLNEALLPTNGKAQPELGLWHSSDPTTVLAIADAFNGPSLGVTELAASLDATQSFKLGIVDYRGDGRPDFLYHARFLYADTASPARINAGGVPIGIRGIGFRRGMSLTVGAAPAAIIAVDENQIFATAPALNGGVQDITITDPSTGAATVMTGAITYGLISGDHLIIVSSGNPLIAVGADTPNPIVIRAVAVDGVTPLPGVNIDFSVSPSASQFTVCGSSSCALTADANGEASVVLTVRSAGSNTVSATLANGEHADATINGTSTTTLSAVKPITT
ncbi:MAG: putative lipoprotein, partial [Acidobacteriaceae bacterium]|nr:putative lipoprotein [Acidobacteriaceae bacterium]